MLPALGKPPLQLAILVISDEREEDEKLRGLALIWVQGPFKIIAPKGDDHCRATRIGFVPYTLSTLNA
jgi:hypothetical protein